MKVRLHEGATSRDVSGYTHGCLTPAVDPIHPKCHVHPGVGALVRARSELPFKDRDMIFELLIFLEDTRMRRLQTPELQLQCTHTSPQILIFSLKNGHGMASLAPARTAPWVFPVGCGPRTSSV